MLSLCCLLCATLSSKIVRNTNALLKKQKNISLFGIFFLFCFVFSGVFVFKGSVTVALAQQRIRGDSAHECAFTPSLSGHFWTANINSELHCCRNDCTRHSNHSTLRRGLLSLLRNAVLLLSNHSEGHSCLCAVFGDGSARKSPSLKSHLAPLLFLIYHRFARGVNT